MLKCQEVSRLAATDEIARAGLLKRLEFRLHLMVCRQCRKYVRQIESISTMARRLLGTPVTDTATLTRLEAEVLQTVGDDAETGSGGTGSFSPSREDTGKADAPGV